MDRLTNKYQTFILDNTKIIKNKSKNILTFTGINYIIST